MLATEQPVTAFPHQKMAYQSRAQLNNSNSSFGSTNTGSHSNRFTSSSQTSTFSNGDQPGLFPPPMPATFSPPPSDAPQATDSIINQRAGADSSLYQKCVNLKKRLADVPGFHEHIVEMNEEEAEDGDFIDPVTAMWNCLRRGFPLMTVYNALRPPHPINVDSSRYGESKIGKACTFQFLKACVNELKLPSTDVFLITDLYGEDTTGFVKVTKCVNIVLDLLQQRGLLRLRPPAQYDHEETIPQSMTMRQRTVDEIVTTERTYVQHLETLQQFKNEVESSGMIAGDPAHDIFLNLNSLIDFQRRFLIRVEQQNGLPEVQQDWGKLFYHYKEYFRVYEPFIANQSRCQETLDKHWINIQRASPYLTAPAEGLLENQGTLLAFLLKPFQRLCKYPMLLEQLRDKGDLDEQKCRTLDDGINAAKSILGRANEAVRKEERIAAVYELSQRVDDWKGHKLEHFGDLLLHGTYTVIKGEGSKEVDREYKVFLFEKILLCCKEFNLSKQKNKMSLGQKSLTDRRGNPKLQLKGRIFMQNVTDIITVARPEKAHYKIQIFWRGDPGVENFIVRFPDERTMKEWEDRISKQKDSLNESARRSGQGGPSQTTFKWQQDQPQPENPYTQRSDDEDDDRSSEATLVNRQLTFSSSRNPSNTSLRSMGAQQANSRARYQPQDLGLQPLSLNTNVPPNQPSPSELPAQSYFSPTQDSPNSLRSSSQASMYGFPRQQLPPSGWPQENNKHRTAPAMPRAPSREAGPPPSNRPSAPPAMASQQYQAQLQAQNRLRSVSTPNMDGPGGRRQQGGQPQPPTEPVPPMPNNIRNPINRSQTASPHDVQIPIRTASQQPGGYYDSRHDRLPRHMDEDMTVEPLRTMPRQAAPSPTTERNGLLPSQLKVKVLFDPSPSHVTIVVSPSIRYQTLVDRIDAKMARVKGSAIGKGTARLRYKDADEDLVEIQTDEDVILAIEEWATLHDEELRQGIMSDFELFWSEKQ